MKKLFLPLVFDEGVVAKADRYIFWPDECVAYMDLESAKEAGRKMVVGNPKAKVVILVSEMVIEPRRIEFSEKHFNSNGELIV